MESLSFEILRKDEVVTSVKYDYKSRKLTIVNYNQSRLHSQLLGATTMREVTDWIETRCFPRTRANADELLRKMGLKVYLPLAIVKKTHGVMYEDFVWIRFEGEKISYKDISIRD